MSGKPRPPVARKLPKELEKHGDVRVDPYYWMKDREDPEVVRHLQAENAYTEAVMSHTAELQETLFLEIKGRIKPDDSSVPYRREDYFYYTRFEEGKEYALDCRKKDALSGDEQVMLDGNLLAEGHDYFAIGALSVSARKNILAYATDTKGRRIYTIRFKDLDTGKLLDDVIESVAGNLAWANDNETLFYTKQDLQTLRWNRVFRHKLGTPTSKDVLVYEEEDETFSVHVYKTKSKRFLVIAGEQTVSHEYRFLPADTPDAGFRLFLPRERRHEYSLGHLGEHFFVLTNKDAKNFRLVKTSVERPEPDHWEEIIPHREDVLLEDFELFRDQLVVVERHRGLRQLRVIPWDGSPEHHLEFDAAAYHVYLTRNVELDTELLRFGYTSLATPRSTFDYNLRTRERTLLKQDEVLGEFDPADYRTERLMATAPDGTEIPVSLVYRRELTMDGTHPLLLYGYGSYGLNVEASFGAARVSLLDRGFVYAIAHIRGGEVMGRQWYDDGKLLKKKNTFTDFIACAEMLLARKYAAPEKLFAMGGSAGGLLMGAVISMRPELFKGVVADVPFVDVVTTMLDESIPLTTSEYDEWGNPNDKTYYDYMLSYSPYDNVEEKDYPHFLVTAGLHDPQVQYWEPAKWVARLRATKTDTNRLLLKTNMDAGHSGQSGRYRRHRETALAYAFLLDLAGDIQRKNAEERSEY